MDATRRLDIHTSDRNNFLRCRRKWNWQSPLRSNLTPKGEDAGALWFGSGFHFAMEDYFGYRRFSEPMQAFIAYAKAFPQEKLPYNVTEMVELADKMFEHYFNWEKQRGVKYKTVWDGDKPLVEMDWRLPIPGLFNAQGEQVYAGGTFDRIVVDEYGRYWVLDYKTAKQFDIHKLATDVQVTNYTWAATTIFGSQFEGCIWQQHIKAWPDEPEVLKKGGLSVNKQQHTSHFLYRKKLIELYGPDSQSWDPKYIDMLNHLAMQETEEGDKFIRRDEIRRNTYQIESEIRNLYMVSTDMVNPNISLYPNPTRDCSWECPFREACIAMDDGSDWQGIIDGGFEEREEWNGWREKIVYPSAA